MRYGDISRHFVGSLSAAALAVLLATGVGCGPGKKAPSATRPAPAPTGGVIGAPAETAIDPSGGSVSSGDGRVVVTVPAAAVAGATRFSVQPITNTAPGGLGNAYRLEASVTSFQRPLTITFASAWTGTTVDRLAIAYQDKAGFWVHAPMIRRNAAAGTLVVTTNHFSDWAIVSADPASDMAGAFTLDSTIDVPFVANGNATLTFSGETPTDRWYVLSGTTTLKQPVVVGGSACTINDDPAYLFPANVAEVLNTPDRFWWGTSAHWAASCGGSGAALSTAFDTQGINLPGCARSYIGTPIITRDRLQGRYVIDCGTRGRVAADWDFFRCGGSCASTNLCHTASISCATGSPVCTDDGNMPNGTTCGTNQVCGDGTCNACTEGASCVPANACHSGTTSCASGFPVCVDTTLALPNGTSCGTNQVCNGGTCSACTAGVSCTPPGNACHAGKTSCDTGVEVCVDTGVNIPDGTTCGTNQVCGGGTCNACTAGVSCPVSGNACHVGTTSCATGNEVCVDTNAPVANGTACGTNAVCNDGSCSACTAGVSCTPANPCNQGTTSCATGVSVCVDTGVPVANGTACGTQAVCNAGACTTCAAGLSCTPSNPCHTGTTSCSTGVSTCVDTGANATAGTSCGTNAVCDGAGTCNACTAGAACTPANACHDGTISCTSGSPVCVDSNTNVANGTSCGTGQVCFAGACGACAQDSACSVGNACVATATIECSSGLPTCTARTNVADQTACGSGLACSSGACVPSTCVDTQPAASCIPLNPCDFGTVSCGPPATCVDTTTPVADGTTCGTDLVCRSGACTTCPAAAGTSCTTGNPCATAATISCATGVPVCQDSAFLPPGSTCGSGLTCIDNQCQ